jgi:tetratricopeptide (TPR) repeat protein
LWVGRRFEESLAALEAGLANPARVPRTFPDFSLRLRKWLLLRRLGRAEEAEAAAREVMALAEKWHLETGGRGEFTLQLPVRAWGLACAGRRDEAIAAGRRYSRATADQNRIRDQRRFERELARIHAHFGQTRECVELLAKLLRVPSGITVPMLRADPDWDNVREDDGFKALLADPKNDAPL